MQRRAFFGSALVVGAGAVLPARAGAQAAHGRAEWDATGHEPADLSALTDEERLHVPVLSLPRTPRLGRPFDLAVQIGVTPHESSEAHHVDWIEVRLDERTVFVADLSVEVPYPVVRVPLVLGAPATLIIRARCTQHGVWVTRRELAPT